MNLKSENIYFGQFSIYYEEKEETKVADNYLQKEKEETKVAKQFLELSKSL